MGTFVLIHGGWHGGWCYSRVAERLRAQRHTVYTPTLSGLAERAHLATVKPINLYTHIHEITDLITAEGLNNIILCGHSYGAMVITGVADLVGARIKTLFYLDSGLPEDNKSLFDMIVSERVMAMLDSAGGTGTMLPPIKASNFGIRAPEDEEWVDKRCTPHPLGCFIQKLKCTRQEMLAQHRTYVLAERYQSINQAAYGRAKSLSGWKVSSIDCGHEVMIDEPDALSRLLLEELER